MPDSVEAAEEDLRASLPMTFKVAVFARTLRAASSNGLPKAAAKLRASLVWLLLNNRVRGAMRRCCSDDLPMPRFRPSGYSLRAACL